MDGRLTSLSASSENLNKIITRPEKFPRLYAKNSSFLSLFKLLYGLLFKRSAQNIASTCIYIYDSKQRCARLLGPILTFQRKITRFNKIHFFNCSALYSFLDTSHRQPLILNA